MTKAARRIRSLVYRSLRTWYYSIFGSAAAERYWRKLPSARAAAEQKLRDAHRPWLIERLRGLGRFESLLEVGCGGGANLVLAAEAFPEVKFAGVDLCPASLELAEDLFRQRNVTVSVTLGYAHDLGHLADRSVDVVLTDATLLYVADDRIADVVAEFTRVAKRCICSLEMHEASPSGSSRARYTRDGWIRDYEALFRSSIPGAALTREKLPADACPVGRWPKYGHWIAARF